MKTLVLTSNSKHQSVFIIFLIFINIISLSTSINHNTQHSLHTTQSELITIPISSVYASSTLHAQSDKSFEASNIISQNKNNFWCSEKILSYDTIVEIKIEFPRLYRVHSLKIEWAIAPGQYAIEYANAKNGFMPTVKGGDIEFWNNVRNNEKLRNEYKTFDNEINVVDNANINEIKIKMKLPINEYFAIYNVKIYANKFDYAIIKPKSEVCLSNNEDYLTANKCAKYIAYGDHREIFIIDNESGKIKSFDNKRCITFSDNVNDIPINTQCEINTNWLIGTDRKIRSYIAMNKCMSYHIENKEIDIKSNFAFEASSTYDLTSEVNNIINDDDSHWKSSLLDYGEKATVIIKPKNKFAINQIVISFASSIAVFDVKLNGEKIIFNYDNKRDSDNQKQNYVINIEENDVNDITQIDIEMFDSIDKDNNMNIFAIRHIKFFSDDVYIKTEFCDDVNSITTFDIVYLNKSEINQIANEKIASQYIAEIKNFEDTKNNFAFYKKYYSNIENELNYMQKIQQKIIDNLKSISSIKDNMNKEIENNFAIIVKDVINKSKKNHFESCDEIKKLNDKKRNGFYLIKTICMKDAIKIFCDFDNKSDLHLIKSETSIKSYEELQNVCSNQGLEPIEINTQDEYDGIISYLNKYKKDSNEIIPIGYNYDNERNGDNKKKIFKSFSSSQSENINDYVFNKKYSDSDLSKLFYHDTIAYDTTSKHIVNKNINEIYPTSIICSTNRKRNSLYNYISLNCNSTIIDLHINTNAKLKVKCPKNCDTSYKVYGSKIYHEHSSICISAIHAGLSNIINSNGLIELNIIEGISHYKSQIQNDIKSNELTPQFINQRAFTVKQYIPMCYKGKSPSSFIEMTDDIEYKNDIKTIDHVHYMQIRNVLTYMNMSKKFNSLLVQSSNIMQELTNTKEGHYGFLNIMKQYLSLLQGGIMIKKQIEQIESFTRSKARESNMLLENTNKEYALLKYGNHFNDSFNTTNITEYYIIDDNKKGEWIYANNKIVHFNKSPHISTLRVKYIDMHDFNLTLSFMISNGEVFGVLFRMIDGYNYYQIEFRHKSISLHKVIGGIATKLDTKTVDEGLISFNKIYNIKIVVVDSLIELHIKNDMNNKYYMILSGNDNFISHGYFSVYTKGYSEVQISHFEIEKISCPNNVPTSKTKRINFDTSQQLISKSSCSNYFYQSYDSFQSLDSNSKWTILSSYDNRENVLSQSILPNITSTYEEGSLYIDSKSNHFCVNNGKISLKFKVENNKGIIGVVFHYENEDNYYICEIGSEFIRLRHKSQGIFELMAINHSYKYSPSNWHKLIIAIDSTNQVNVFFTPSNLHSPIEQVFPKETEIPINDLHTHYYVGLSTYNSIAYFDEFALNTLNIKDDNDKLSNDITIKNLMYNNKCIKYTTEITRNKYCKKNHPNEQNSCYHSFCENCCNDNMKDKTRNNLISCVKECELAKEAKTYKECYVDENIYDTQCKDSVCKRDMCYLCCSSIYEIALTNKERKECYKGCNKTYK